MKQRLFRFTFCLSLLMVLLVAIAGNATPANPKQTQQDDLHQLRKRYPLERPKATTQEIQTAIVFLDTIRLEGTETISKELARPLSAAVRSLSYAATAGLPEGKQLSALLDRLFQHHVIERYSRLVYSSYGDVRTLPADLLSALTACDANRQQRLIAAVKRLIEFDKLYQDAATVRNNVNTDYLYNVLPHLFVCALYQPDASQAVKDLHAFSHYLSACTQYTTGAKDGLKIDGIGYHHWTHYNGYMYAYQTWVEYMARLKGTAFRVQPDAYYRLARAIVSEYLMATVPTHGEGHYFANSLAGRHPFSGLDVAFTPELFRKLVTVGGDLQGTEIDPELAAYYNAFFPAETPYPGIPVKKLDGFYAFNYSPIGVYRHDNWVATMRCPTTCLWGGEIYNGTNRFGRYQSHGTLEILYNGSLIQSGYPDGWERFGGQRGGWDWNIVPGSTTVHYTDWKEMTPNGNNADRFDQWALTTTFSGALSWGDCGLWACTFDQGDAWGSRRFIPTNLTFCKSVFAIDGILISLGSGIGAPGNYTNNRLTATNLFQALDDNLTNTLVLDGKEIGRHTTITPDANQPHWLITSCTTGYFIPAGNDPLVLTCGNQTTPGPEGISPTSFGTRHASKAYLNHGIKPVGKRYCFAIVPHTTPRAMSTLSKRLLGEKGRFEIRQHQDSLHILRHTPSSTLAYALFAPSTNLHEGHLRSTDTPLLLMERPVGESQLDLAVCSPDLRPQTIQGNKVWLSQPTITTLTLDGHWQPADRHTENLRSCTYEGTHTRLTLELRDGLTLQLRLKRIKLRIENGKLTN